MIDDALQAADDKTVSALEQLEGSVFCHRGIFVAGVGRRDLSGRDLQDSQPDRDEHLDLIAGAQCLVGLLQNLGRRPSQHGAALQNHFGNHHEQSRRNALAAHVRHDHAQMILVDQEEVIEIAADLSRGVHFGIQIEFLPVRERRENMRQHAGLNLICHVQLRADPLLFLCDLRDVLDVLLRPLRQLVKRQRQHFDFIIGPVTVLHLEQSSGFAAVNDIVGHLLEGTRDFARRAQRNGDAEEQQQCDCQAVRPFEPVRAGPEGGRRVFIDPVIFRQHLLLRRLRDLLVDQSNRCPADRRHGRAGCVILLSVQCDDGQPRRAVQRFVNEFRHFRIFRLYEILSDFKQAVVRRREQNLSHLIDNKRITAAA